MRHAGVYLGLNRSGITSAVLNQRVFSESAAT